MRFLGSFRTCSVKSFSKFLKITRNLAFLFPCFISLRNPKKSASLQVFKFYNSNRDFRNLRDKSYATWFPVDTGRELKIHKTFRGRPGRLLNVLCTFTLRPVSAGFELSLSIWRKLIHELFGFNHNFLGG